MTTAMISSFLPACNSSIVHSLTPSHPHYPIYHPTGTSILPFMTDKVFSLLAPIVAYWVFSLIWHAIDTAQMPYFEKYRIHETEEVLSRNRTTVRQVIEAVALQQVIQTALGWFWLETEEEILKREIWRDHTSDMRGLARLIGQGVQLLVGEKTGLSLVRLAGGENVTGWVYWWGIPLLQMGIAFFVMDTWQYFLHRLFHTVPFLYRNFHSVHHKLYVPYAFGALYNHPLEGLLLDSLGAVLAHSAAGMTVRQSIVLFAVSTMKTVDDHCGYKIWWDPFQAVFGNNSEYHDLHHQSWGIKKNFSQPFFTKWDDILGTRMSKEQAARMYARRAAAKAEAIANSVAETVVSVAEAVVPASILPDHHTERDDEDTPSEASSTPAEEIDSGIELEEVGTNATAKSSAVQVGGVQTRARTRRV